MSLRYETTAINRDGGTGVSEVPGGLRVRVDSPLRDGFDTGAANPEQLLALAWATCLNATAQAVVAGARRTAVRIEVGLHDDTEHSGFVFHVDAYLSAEGADEDESARILTDAHARCPVSRLLRDAATVRVHHEPYRPA